MCLSEYCVSKQTLYVYGFVALLTVSKEHLRILILYTGWKSKEKSKKKKQK